MFLLIALMMGAFAGKVERPRYHTAYACEGNNLKISCENGQLIQLLRANYGRFSISICNEQGILNWSVKCASEKSYFVIHESCIVNVTSNTFGDPCPETYKYLEVQYQCMLEFNPLSSTMSSTTTSTTTTTRPPIVIPITKSRTTTSTTTTTPSTTTTSTTTTTRPPIIIPITKSRTTTTTTPTTEHPIPTTLSLSSSISTFISISSNSTNTFEYDRKFTRSKTETTTVYHSSSSPPPVFHNALYCPPVIARSILWNWTREGQVAIEKCPGGSTGYARWQCGTKPVVWLPQSPDLSECQSMWVDNVHRKVDGEESIVGIATELAVITKTKPLYGGDIRQVAGITQRLVAKMAVSAKDVRNSEQRYLGFPNHQRQQIARELLELMTEISSNLLERYHHDSWRDLPIPEQRASASALIRGLEESCWLLLESQTSINRFHTVEKNLLVSVRRIQTWSISEVRFPTSKDVEGSEWTRMEDFIIVPTQALLGVAQNGVVDIVFLAYNKLENFLTAADRGIFSRPLSADKQSNSSHIINSRVLAASVRRHGLANLHQPAKIVFRHIQEENVTNPRCVYWDFNNRMWSGEGCWTTSTNRTHTVCSCSHFTNFALLMEASSMEQNEVFEKTSKVAVWNGCRICMAFILLTFLLLMRLRRLKGDIYTIRKNILVCLFLAETVFLIGIEQATNRIVCGVCLPGLY
ncbi:latrophilin Cirl-like [Limulus polyphemus]|uniref:Latrophilin Cirl-like n=1 Tax=Limulus polyphemus TaxID=6850 RepID=A0ABM1SY75_LIMPO|nr:latrophilin Cirl-like [Limulus polyphemus]